MRLYITMIRGGGGADSTESKFLKDVFNGIYAGSVATPLGKKGFKNLAYTKAMLGLPSLKKDSDKSFKQSLERLLFPLQNKKFRIFMVAKSYDIDSIKSIISNLLEIKGEIEIMLKNLELSHKDYHYEVEHFGANKTIKKFVNESYDITPLIRKMISLYAEYKTRKNMILKQETEELEKELATLKVADKNSTDVNASIKSNSINKNLDLANTIAKMFGIKDKDISNELYQLEKEIRKIQLQMFEVNDTWIKKRLQEGIDELENKAFMLKAEKKKESTGLSSMSHNPKSTDTNQKIYDIGQKIRKKTNSIINKTTKSNISNKEIISSAEYCENLIDKYVQRFQKGLNDGMWNVSVYLQSDSKSDLEHISYVLKSVYSGEESFYEHIRFSDSFESSTLFKRENVIYPFIESNLQSNALHSSFNGFSSALNTLELSLLNALPLKDVTGISIQKYSSFGLTQDSKDYIESKNMQIGYILNRKFKTNQRFYLSNEAINSHIFVSGEKDSSLGYLLNFLFPCSLLHSH